LAIAPVAALYGLGFTPVLAERYDFAIPESRWDRPSVEAFRKILADPNSSHHLAGLGFQIEEEDR
jgi:putative molybdopterin biosynthesis protein